MTTTIEKDCRGNLECICAKLQQVMSISRINIENM